MTKLGNAQDQDLLSGHLGDQFGVAYSRLEALAGVVE